LELKSHSTKNHAKHAKGAREPREFFNPVYEGRSASGAGSSASTWKAWGYPHRLAEEPEPHLLIACPVSSRTSIYNRPLVKSPLFSSQSPNHSTIRVSMKLIPLIFKWNKPSRRPDAQGLVAF
jgi:hypothetical protein